MILHFNLIQRVKKGSDGSEAKRKKSLVFSAKPIDGSASGLPGIGCGIEADTDQEHEMVSQSVVNEQDQCDYCLQTAAANRKGEPEELLICKDCQAKGNFLNTSTCILFFCNFKVDPYTLLFWEKIGK